MKVLKITTIAAALFLLAVPAMAQSQEDAINSFNKGLEEAQAENYDAAINSIENAISIAEELGSDGEDILERATEQLPTIYFRKAAAAYKAYQQDRSLENIESAIEGFKEAGEVAEEYSNEQIAQRANGVIPQLYYQMSVQFYSEEEFDKADEAVETALNLNSNYALAYYQKAKIFKKQNDTEGDGIIDQNYDEMMQWYDRAIQVGQSTQKDEVVEKAREAAHDELLAAGTTASEDDDLELAFELLTKALDYNAESADVNYRLAEAHNKAGNAEQAAEHAQTALEYENGGRTDRAKIYYELGVAQQTLGNKSDACDALTNALYGSFKSPAEHIMEYELECDSTAP